MIDLSLSHASGSDAKQLSASEEIQQYLTFLVGKDFFATNILEVNEIIEVGALTEMPMMPDFIRGVINLRGEAVPVIDLSAKLRRGQSDLTKRSCIILVQINTPAGEQTIGMLVDEVNEILEIAGDCIQPPPNLGSGINTDFIQAMGRVEEKFIVLLDMDHILSAEELGSMEQLAQLHQGAGDALSPPSLGAEVPGESGGP
jgi:purine-binding chemotaxis protein CheW